MIRTIQTIIANLTKNSKDIHIVPVDDLYEHDLSTRCFCEPMVIVDGDVVYYVHKVTNEIAE
jgi:hypothetical protein